MITYREHSSEEEAARRSLRAGRPQAVDFAARRTRSICHGDELMKIQSPNEIMHTSSESSWDRPARYTVSNSSSLHHDV